MREELREKIERFNANARQARADGRYVSGGKVYDHAPAYYEVLGRPLCDVMDYERFAMAEDGGIS